MDTTPHQPSLLELYHEIARLRDKEKRATNEIWVQYYALIERDNKVASLQTENKRLQQRLPRGTKYKTSSTQTPSFWLDKQTTLHRTTPQPATKPAAPSNTTSSSIKIAKLTPQDKQSLADNPQDHCFRCRQPGHRSFDECCPNNRWKP